MTGTRVHTSSLLVGTAEFGKDLVPGVGVGTLYKYHIRSRFNGYRVDKTDPLAVL